MPLFQHHLKHLFIALVAIAASSSFAHAYASELNLPPSAELSYALKSSQKGIPISGEAKVKWQWQENKTGKRTYALSSDTSVMMLGKILSTSSTGTVSDSTLIPEKFTEKRWRKDEASTQFDQKTKSISFTDSYQNYTIKGGEQDRSSVTWQLVSLLRSSNENFKPGYEWKVFVAGLRDAEYWTFKVLDIVKINTAFGEVEAIHLLREPPPDAKSQRLELWLASSLEYYPLRISFVEPGGDHVDQRLIAIKKINDN